MYFLKLALIFMSTELFILQHMFFYYSNMCKWIFTDTNGKVTADCCSILFRSSVALYYNAFVRIIYSNFEAGRICVWTSDISVKTVLENSYWISALKMRTIKLFLVYSFRIVFRSPGNTRQMGRSTKEVVIILQHSEVQVSGHSKAKQKCEILST